MLLAEMHLRLFLACKDQHNSLPRLQAVINIGPGYWAVVLLDAVSTGFDGALSTVSTLVNEVRFLHCDVILCSRTLQVEKLWHSRI